MHAYFLAPFVRHKGCNWGAENEAVLLADRGNGLPPQDAAIGRSIPGRAARGFREVSSRRQI